jgi:hypothetical protein
MKRIKWNFWKLCGSCGEIFGSDNLDEFMDTLRNHKCEEGIEVKRDMT